MDENAWQNTNNGVVTKSRLRMWWLVQFHGYSVDRKCLEPQASLLGTVRMQPRWVLSEPDAPTSEGQ